MPYVVHLNIGILEFGIWNIGILGFGILEFGIWDLEYWNFLKCSIVRKKITISPTRCSTGQKYSLLLGIIMLFLCGAVWGQEYFKTVAGIPHLPILSTAPTENLSSGLMYINSTDNILYWYNGSQWVSVGTFGVTTSVSGTATNVGYFGVKGGNPVIPVLAAAPTGIAAGAVYFNSSNNNFYWYNGSAWVVEVAMVHAADVSFTTDAVCYTNTSYTATYNLTYSDNISASNCAESGTTFQWYRATDAAGTNKAAISGAASSGYTVSSADVEYYVSVGVKCQTSCGANAIEVFSPWLLVKQLVAPDGTIVELITSSTGRVWMDRNLGASRVATSKTDTEARGSLFQWCRNADGHELRTSSIVDTVSTVTTTTSGYWINGSGWLSLDITLNSGNLWWDGTSTPGVNNPCPVGFHVPTYTEFAVEQNARTYTYWYADLKFVDTGNRLYSGSLNTFTASGIYWSSTISNASTTSSPGNAWYLSLYETSPYVSIQNYMPGYGFAVRCIRDVQ